MQLEVDLEHSLARVSLSESNVLALLSQLAGFHEDAIGVRRLVESNWWLRVAPQPDRDHVFGPEGLAFSVSPARREVLVVFSASNLAVLRGQARTGDPSAPLTSTAENGWILSVIAESDEQHYAGRRRGRMGAITEQAMEQFRQGGDVQ